MKTSSKTKPSARGSHCTKPTKQEKPVAAGCDVAPDENWSVLPGCCFVITTAQNNTHVHAAFLKSLKRYCTIRGGQLLVCRTTYNKNGFQNLDKTREGLWYDPALTQYLMPSSATILGHSDGPVLCAELDILPTAVRPLSGLTNYTRGAACIVPHVKVAMESVPTQVSGTDVFTKLMFTTGAVTQRNYIQRKAGQVAQFHHVFGALVVEVNPATGKWYIRQLISDKTGEFYDLDRKYSPTGDVHVRPEALVVGDIHLPHTIQVPAVTGVFGEFGIVQSLRPKRVVLHDLLDFTSRNWHTRNNGRYRVLFSGIAVKDELTATVEFLAVCTKQAPADTQWLAVWSNHLDGLIRWAEECRWQDDPPNAELLLQVQMHLVQYARRGMPRPEADARTLTALMRGSSIKVLRRDESYMIKGVELGMHGHLGPNGARGTAVNMNTIGRKCTIGHGHSARIVDGVYQVGVLCPLRMDYNEGPSSWSYTHCLVYANGKRAMLTQRGEDWNYTGPKETHN